MPTRCQCARSAGGGASRSLRHPATRPAASPRAVRACDPEAVVVADDRGDVDVRCAARRVVTVTVVTTCRRDGLGSRSPGQLPDILHCRMLPVRLPHLNFPPAPRRHLWTAPHRPPCCRRAHGPASTGARRRAPARPRGRAHCPRADQTHHRSPTRTRRRPGVPTPPPVDATGLAPGTATPGPRATPRARGTRRPGTRPRRSARRSPAPARPRRRARARAARGRTCSRRTWPAAAW